MTKRRMTVELEPDEMNALEELAAHDRRTVEDMVTLAVRNYIARRATADDEWKRRWDAAIADLRSGVPDDVTPEEVDADVRTARTEYREQRRARHG